MLNIRHLDGCGFESDLRQPIFLLKMPVSDELCCVALPFYCVVVVALPFLASLGMIVHAQYLVWGLVYSWFHYRGVLLNTTFEFTCYQVEMLSDLYAGFGPAS